MNFSAKLQKHLSRGYVRIPEGGKNSLKDLPQKFQHWVIIPVCDEPDLPATLRQWRDVLPANGAILLVINHPENADAERKERNRALLQKLRQGDGCGMAQDRLFWVDAASAGQELHHGVGEARRIGYDTALSLLRPDSLKQSLLVACDGDTLIHPQYWKILTDTARRHPGCGAFCLGVHHQKGRDDAEEKAIRKYEEYLQAYVDGLQLAGSPYAYHSIGSAIAVRADAYLQAGGMRVCEAGEDFYFLQALRKITPVYQMSEAIVFPSARPSDRVPFGTGRAMLSLLGGTPLPVYPAVAFEQLRMLLAGVTEEALQSAESFLAARTPEARRFLEENHFSGSWARVLGNLPARNGARAAAFHQWFDALRTYRFIHSFMAEFRLPPVQTASRNKQEN